MGRWSEAEERALLYMRQECSTELREVAPYPEVVGDRRLVRFLRGKQGNVDEAASQYKAFLKWRVAGRIDDIRFEIVSNNLSSPLQFPSGAKILDVLPQYVVLPGARDLSGQPIVVEFFGCDIGRLFSEVTMTEYLRFVTYVLEYRAMVLEQLSEEEEREYLRTNSDPLARCDNYGVVLRLCVIRDLDGVGLQHVGTKGKEMIIKSLDIAIPNYPEYAGRTFFLNTPLVFYSVWIFLATTVLDQNILQKTVVYGRDFIDNLSRDIPINCIPIDFGGKYVARNSDFKFDFSSDGPLAVMPQSLSRRSSSASLNNSRNNSSGNLQQLAYRRSDEASGISKEFGTPTGNSNNNNVANVTLDNGGNDRRKFGFIKKLKKVLRRASKVVLLPRRSTASADFSDSFNTQLVDDSYSMNDVLVENLTGPNSPGTPLAGEKTRRRSRSRSSSNLVGLANEDYRSTGGSYIDVSERERLSSTAINKSSSSSGGKSNFVFSLDIVFLVALSILGSYVIARLFL